MTVGPLLPGGGHASRFDPAPYLAAEKLTAGLADRSREPDGLVEIVGRLSASYRKMKQAQAGLPAAWVPSGEWAHYIAQRQPVYAALLAGDVSAAARVFAQFWRNELQPIVKEYATFEALTGEPSEQNERFVHNIVRNWLVWKDLVRQPTSVLQTPNIGNVWGYEIDGVVVTPKACRYHLLATELAGMVAGKASPVIAEIGGGYGGLAEFFLREHGSASWLDYDLPETAMIAAFFHMGARGPDKVVLYGETATPRKRTDVVPGMTYILPNFELRELEDRSTDVVVNMFSLSEVGREPLDALLERIQSVTGEWFVHHNMDRHGVVNRGHERIPASTFAIDRSRLPVVATGFDPFHGVDGDYRWYIHRRPAE